MLLSGHRNRHIDNWTTDERNVPQKIKRTLKNVKNVTKIKKRTDKLKCLPSYNRPRKTQRKLKATVGLNRCS